MKDFMLEETRLKTTIEVKGNSIIFKCEPNDKIEINCGGRKKEMTRTEAVKFFWNEIGMGDNLEVEQGAYGLFDALAGNKCIETEF